MVKQKQFVPQYVAMAFDLSMLASGQRWRVHYTAESLTQYSFDFTLDAHQFDATWSTKDSTAMVAVLLAHENWWSGVGKNYEMILLCSNVDFKTKG